MELSRTRDTQKNWQGHTKLDGVKQEHILGEHLWKLQLSHNAWTSVLDSRHWTLSHYFSSFPCSFLWHPNNIMSCHFIFQKVAVGTMRKYKSSFCLKLTHFAVFAKPLPSTVTLMTISLVLSYVRPQKHTQRTTKERYPNKISFPQQMYKWSPQMPLYAVI